MFFFWNKNNLFIDNDYLILIVLYYWDLIEVLGEGFLGYCILDGLSWVIYRRGYC
jgi:hypothetical protein